MEPGQLHSADFRHPQVGQDRAGTEFVQQPQGLLPGGRAPGREAEAPEHHLENLDVHGDVVDDQGLPDDGGGLLRQRLPQGRALSGICSSAGRRSVQNLHGGIRPFADFAERGREVGAGGAAALQRFELFPDFAEAVLRCRTARAGNLHPPLSSADRSRVRSASPILTRW